MIEIIAALVGVIAGGLLTWILNRKSPSHVICEEDFSAHIALNLPGIRFLFRDVPLNDLHITRLNFRNIGGRVLEKPVFTVKFEDTSEIIGAVCRFKPIRGETEDDLCHTEMQKSTLKIIPSDFYPYEINNETLIVDIFTKTETSIVTVVGYGKNSDGTGWSVIRRKKWIDLPLLGVAAPANPFARVLGLGLYVTLLVTIFMIIGYFIWLLSKGLITINSVYFETMRNSLIFWIVVIFASLVVLIALWLGFFRGWPFPVPLPFKRLLWIQVRRRK